MSTYSFNPNLLFLNIGLKVGDKIPASQKNDTITMLRLMSVLCNLELEALDLVDGETEPTIVAVLSGFRGCRAVSNLRPDDVRERFDSVLASLASALHQDAIAALEVEWRSAPAGIQGVVAKAGPGELFGPKAVEWGKFDPKRFIMRPNGDTLAKCLKSKDEQVGDFVVTMVVAEDNGVTS